MMRKRPTSQPAAVGRRPGPTDSQGRERLLDVAIGLFAERGIANTTVAQIAEAGKVTSAMIHYWFDTREKLLEAIVDERLAPLIQRLWEPADAQHDSVPELVQALLIRMLDVTEEMPWLPSLWLREVMQEGGLLRERSLGHIPRDRNVAFQRDIAAAQERGEINPQIMPQLLFFSMLGLVMLPQAGFRSWRRHNPDSTINRATLERHLTGLVMHGLTGGVQSRGARSRTRPG